MAEKFKGCFRESEPLVLGQMLHRIFQTIATKYEETGGSQVPQGAHREDINGTLTSLQDAVIEEMKSTLTSMDSLDHL